MITLKKITQVLLLLVLNTTIALAQVGIGTTDPQTSLHIGGTNSTMRIDGLNSVNNTNNTGVRNQPVYANSAGDLVIPSSPAGSEILFSGTDFINSSSSSFVRTGYYGEGNRGEVSKTTFTLSQPAIVLISYSLSFSVRNRADTSSIKDGKARLITSHFYMGNGATANTSMRYGVASQTYTSLASSYGHHTVEGYSTNTATAMLFLPAGTHSIHMYGGVYGGNGITSPRSSDAFGARFGAGTDQLFVVALY